MTSAPRLLLAALLLAAPLRAQTASSRASVAIGSARRVYREVEDALKRRQLVRRDTVVTCESDGLDSHGSIYVDGAHRIRRLDTEGGTDDHGEQVSTWFDTRGRARFAYAVRGAVNGTRQEERVYYDERGRVVRRLVQTVHGPGYHFDTLTTVPRLSRWVRELCG